MKLLILGGTRFVGRHLVEYVLTAGHEVTLFNRNQGSPGLFPDVEILSGDRTHDVSALSSRSWDAAIDTSAYTPQTVRLSTERLQDAVGHYTFISTVSVYRDFARQSVDETAPLGDITEQDLETEEANVRSGKGVSSAAYGPLKARCEAVVKELFTGRSLVVRPGLVVGEHDYTDRFTYWVRRIGQAGKQRGRRVLAPGHANQPVQFIDAEDLATWTVEATVQGVDGIFNATGPEDVLTFGTFLETCRAVVNPDAELVWVGDEFMLERGHSGGELMPWLPAQSMPGWEGFFSISAQKAITRGLAFQPLGETVRATFLWDQTRGEVRLKSGLTKAQEATLLDDWGKTDR